MAMQSICAQYQIEDPKTDYESARPVGRIRMSDQAFYFSGFPGTKYLPFSAIRRIWTQKSTIAAKCGCGSIPMPIVLLRILYGNNDYRSFTFQWQEEADEILAGLKKLHPEIPQEPESK